MPNLHMTRHPDYPESLRLLVQREQYTYREISFMFGLSLERIRQHCAMFGIQKIRKRGGITRVWDDERLCFYPMHSKDARIHRAAYRKRMRRSDLDAVRGQRIQEIRVVLKDLRAALGREPLWIELSRAVLRRPELEQNEIAYLIHYAKMRSLRALRHEIGLQPRRWVRRPDAQRATSL